MWNRAFSQLLTLGLLAAAPLGLAGEARGEEVSEGAACKTWFSRKVHRTSAFQAEANPVIVATQAMGGCTSENRPYHGAGIDFLINGQKVGITLRSIDFPEAFDALEPALKTRAEEPLSAEDRSFALAQLLPLVEEAAAESDDDLREQTLAKARALWKNYLAPRAPQALQASQN